LRLLGKNLLQSTLDAAGGLQQATQQQHLQAVSWLLQQTPASSKSAAGLAGILALLPAEGLLRLPALPFSWARTLLEAGVRINFAQLVDAARSMVLGVEVWVQALDRMVIQTDIPAAAFEICCGGDWMSKQVMLCFVHYMMRLHYLVHSVSHSTSELSKQHSCPM
jgi:hypothetical protein